MIVLENIAVGNGGARWVRVRMQWGGVVASVNVRTIGKGGKTFSILVRMYSLNNSKPLYEKRSCTIKIFKKLSH